MSLAAHRDRPPSEEGTRARWRELHRQFAIALVDRPAVGEPDLIAGQVSSLDERLVQAIWHDQLLKKDELATASGKRVEIIEPGRWNTARGPDFLDARLRVAGELLQGDIEIHVNSADWHRHAHHQDFEYNRVILHAVLRANDDRPYQEKQNGERLEQLVLEPILEPDLETIQSTINLGDYPYGRPAHLGLCHEQFLRLPETQFHEFMITAGRTRIEDKVARFRAQMQTADFYQVIYQALLTAQGFKASKTLYFLLSKRAPLRELVELARDVRPEDRGDFYLSVLLHVGQIVPGQKDLLEDSDEESAAFRDKLQKLWNNARPYFSDRLIPPTRRWFAGMRPAGFPTRRLAAVAVLLGRLTDGDDPLFQRFRTRVKTIPSPDAKPKEMRRFWKELAADFLVSGEEHYFGTHFTLGGKKQRPQALLGEPAARSLVFNVFLPMAVLDARRRRDEELETRAWEAIQTFPSLEKNSVVRFMDKRIFGESGLGKGLLKTEIYQQALMKVFGDCCAQNERTCDDCTFFALAEQAGPETATE